MEAHEIRQKEARILMEKKKMTLKILPTFKKKDQLRVKDRLQHLKMKTCTKLNVFRSLIFHINLK